MSVAWIGMTSCAGLNFATADLDGTFEKVQATGAEVIQEPMDQGYGRDCAFRDPAGNMIRIIESAPRGETLP